jgi:hypothetical protein
MIVPEQDFIHRKLGVLSTANQSQDIASEEHFNNADATIEFYIIINTLMVLPLLKVSLKGNELKILKPF